MKKSNLIETEKFGDTDVALTRSKVEHSMIDNNLMLVSNSNENLKQKHIYHWSSTSQLNNDLKWQWSFLVLCHEQLISTNGIQCLSKTNKRQVMGTSTSMNYHRQDHELDYMIKYDTIDHRYDRELNILILRYVWNWKIIYREVLWWIVARERGEIWRSRSQYSQLLKVARDEIPRDLVFLLLKYVRSISDVDNLLYYCNWSTRLTMNKPIKLFATTNSERSLRSCSYLNCRSLRNSRCFINISHWRQWWNTKISFALCHSFWKTNETILELFTVYKVSLKVPFEIRYVIQSMFLWFFFFID